MTICKRDSSNRSQRYLLLNPEGKLVWLGNVDGDAASWDRFPGWAEVSPSGRRFAFSDGHLIHILTVEGQR